MKKINLENLINEMEELMVLIKKDKYDMYDLSSFIDSVQYECKKAIDKIDQMEIDDEE